MLVLHFVTHLFPPAHGGLEAWLLRLARLLQSDDVRPIVHIRATPAEFDYAGATEIENVPVRIVGTSRAEWEEPLLGGTNSERLASERWRLDFLALRNTVEREVAAAPAGRHVLVSTSLLPEGFIAQRVADSLALQHVACALGSDFSRFFHDPLTHTAVAAVVLGATSVVTINGEQERAFRRIGATRIRTIHLSVPDPGGARWQRGTRTGASLFSDGGYSHKKGTQVLLRAFGALRDEGLPLRLTICGDMQAGQESYWRAVRADYRARYGDAVTLEDYVEPRLLRNVVQDHDVYCLATLGEGCSLARMARLCAGMPMVTTRCGEIPDVASGVSHVRTAAPADAAGFLDALRRACVDLLDGSITIDSGVVERWQTHFSPVREREDWLALLAQL